MPTPYEKARMENVKRNRDMLLAMGLDNLKTYVPSKSDTKDAAPVAKSRKRKSSPPQDARDGGEEFGTKAVKTRATQDITNTSGVRRSARNTGKTIDYKSEVVKTFPEAISTAARIAMKSEKKASSGRRHNPYVDSSSAPVALFGPYRDGVM
jgi:E3 ubiquitin-protein ligase UHRF1